MSKQQNIYKETLNLPKTKFPMKANLAQREPGMLAQWEESGLYNKLREIAAVADGALPPAKLQRALDAIETPADRRARRARQAREQAQRQRQVKIEELLGIARANNNKKDGKRALSALEELLVLSPGHMHLE